MGADSSDQAPTQPAMLGPEVNGAAQVSSQVRPVLLCHKREQLPHKPLLGRPGQFDKTT